MTQSKKSNTKDTSKDQPKDTENSMSVAELKLRDKIVEEAKKIALLKNSSAFDLVQATKELLRFEDSQKTA